MSLDRRELLLGGGAAGVALLLGFCDGEVLLAQEATGAAGAASALAPDAFVRIDADGAVTIWVSRQEMGQGARTVLPMLVAEELEADWARVRVVQAPLDARYGEQRTGGSLSVRELWEPLRRTGATAREMLLAAAAERLGVPRAELAARAGEVVHAGSGRRAAYGDLVAAASRLPVPEAGSVPLKEPKDFRLIGTSVPRTDGPEIVTGRARFGIDVRLPGMLYASFERCPVPGGRLRRFDARRAERVPGVRSVLAVDGREHGWMLQWAHGVAVVAESSWAALRGREALEIEWDEGPNAGLDQDDLIAELARLCREPGTVTRREGDVGKALAAARAGGRVVTAQYVAPYLSHSPLEPMNAVADVRPGRCRIVAPVQFPATARALAARVTGLPESAVEVEIPLLGGGFGRRIYADYAGEAALLSKAVGAPVQLLWTREDDTRHGFYRPLSVHRLEASLGPEGELLAWHHRIAGPSRDAARGPDVENPERSEVYGVNEMPYAVPNLQVEFRHRYVPLPCGPWRGVAYSQAGFVVEGFVDELARAAGQDPLAFRRRLLDRDPFPVGGNTVDPRRMRRTLDAAAEAAGWGRPLPPGRGRGIAVTADHGSCAAHVAEVSVGSDGTLRVHRIVTALDCGPVVHPDMVAAQVEGAVAFALSATLKGEITLRRGRVEQSSYADCDVIRMGEMPRVEVHTLAGSEAPGGVGEPPLPGVAPAVLNAVADATGARVRKIPVRKVPR